MEMNSSSVAGSPQIMILDLDGELDASNLSLIHI